MAKQETEKKLKDLKRALTYSRCVPRPVRGADNHSQPSPSGLFAAAVPARHGIYRSSCRVALDRICTRNDWSARGGCWKRWAVDYCCRRCHSGSPTIDLTRCCLDCEWTKRKKGWSDSDRIFRGDVEMRRSRLNGRLLRTPGSPSINPFQSQHTPHSPFGEAITRFTQINGTELLSMGFPRQFAVKRTYRVMILSIGGRLGLRRRLTAKFLWWKLLFCCTISVFVIIWVLNLDLKSKKVG